MNYNFFNPTKMVTGEGCVQKNAREFLKLGKSCLIITSGSAAKKSGALDDVTEALDSLNIAYEIFDGIGQNPMLETCLEAGETAKAHGLEFIIGIGGGSPLDAAKAAAVYAANTMRDGMDIFKTDWPNPALPIIAVGTTAGTGSEVTCFSILTMPNGRKKSFGNDETYPKIMFADYKYTKTLPLDFTKSTALDALAHALEAYFSSAANEISDMYAIKAMSLLCPLLKVLKGAKSISDITDAWREEMYFASIIAGYALSHCGTLYCHNISYYFTENYGVPHGFACAVTLPDLIGRGMKYANDRAETLLKAPNISADELCGLITSLTVFPEIKLSDAVIRQISADGALTKNFAKTIPNGFSADDASELLTRLFGK